MPTTLLHPSVRIAHPKCTPVPPSSPIRAAWTRAGDWLVAIGERATHHRMGSWTRR